MEIKHPRRILVVGGPNSGAVQVVKDLTGSAPILNEANSTASVTHEWTVTNAYYTATIPIWMDEITDASAWKTEFLKPEAKEVVHAVGAWIYCFRQSSSSDAKSGLDEARKVLESIQEVVEEHAGYAADTVMLAVSVPSAKGIASSTAPSRHAEWEDLCIEHAFEYIDYAGQGLNEFREKTGFDRLKEALEANEWGAGGDEDDEADLGFGDLEGDDENDMHGFARDEAEMTAELFGMKAALTKDGFDDEDEEEPVPFGEQATQVDDLDRLMGRLLAVKEESANLPEAQRKRMAARAVRELMRDDGGR